jgi:hypothetical protein
MPSYYKFSFFILSVLILTHCNQPLKHETVNTISENSIGQKVDAYKKVRLTADLSSLSENEKAMIPKLIEAAKMMDDLFWYETLGDKDAFFKGITNDTIAQFARINYGPWDRLDNNTPFVDGFGTKPDGANFYPSNMTKEEFEASNLPLKSNAYTFLRRDENGQLYTIPYHEQFKNELSAVAKILNECAALAEDEGLKKYLLLRSEALLTDEYRASDMAWMDMKTNGLDIVIGPIENYEDKLYAYKSTHEAYVLIKDKKWSNRLSRYASMLPNLQKGLPVADQYKAEKPGTDADLNAYDVVFYAGEANAGSKTIAINLPNDEQVQLEKGARRLQLKNAMQAKFDEILNPISKILIADEQQKHVTFNAFFSNVMFHEVAHGLGIKNTINNKGSVRQALKEHNTALEEGKADILGLYMVKQLHALGEIEGDIKDQYVTFMAGILRSVRFGASSSHGKANMICFNYFQENGAFAKTEDGKYRVDFDKMEKAMIDLSALILKLQGDGDYDAVAALIQEKGVMNKELQADLDKLANANIPVDIIFEQGADVLGL